ncbi:family 2 glycosyl transferase, partial [Malaciobacter mytili]|uniref:glycosyltransferase family A protein n=1 Tax=Malaciobacter mytili TaxID=603050 RepID=UPI0010251F20
MKKIAFLTTIFTMPEEYLYDFFNSLEKQTYKYFDIIIVNDGFNNLDIFIEKYKELNIFELKGLDNIAKNRQIGINYCIDNNYDILIFGDSDDYFKENRIMISLDKLEKYDIVVNDLTLFDKNGIIEKQYISNRIENNTEIDFGFIKDKNIFGLSNTAIS